MRVRAAAPHLRVPREDNPRAYIGAKPREVPESLYYRRRVATGELVRVEETPEAPPVLAAPKPARKPRRKSTPSEGSTA